MFQLVPNSFIDNCCSIIVSIMIIYNFIRFVNNRKGTGIVFLVIIMVLYSLFYRPINGDFWHYYIEYIGDLKYKHMEDFYYQLIEIVPDNYLLWRILIWLPAAIFIGLVFKLLKIPGNIATVSFFVFGLASYYYTRNALGLSILYFAMAIVSSTFFKKKILSYLIAITLLVTSWYLHRSMPLYIGILLLAYLLPFNRKYILCSLIIFPLINGSITLISSDVLNMSNIWIDEETGFFYIEQDNTSYTNWKGYVGLFINYVPVIYFLVIAFRSPIPRDSCDFGSYKLFLLFTFFLIVLSFLFYGKGSEMIQGRLYKSALLPLSFVVGLYFKYYKSTRRCWIFIMLMLVSYAWSVLINVVNLF